MGQPGVQAAPGNRANRKRILIPIAIVVLAGLAYVVYWFAVVRGTVYTDDAQIQAMMAPCSSRVGGRVIELPVLEGQAVKKGQVLARLDDVPYKNQRDEAAAAADAAKAQMSAATLNLKKARNALPREIASAEADVRSAAAREKFTRKEKERYDHLQGVVADEAVDQARATWNGSSAALDAAIARLSLLAKPEERTGDTTTPPRALDVLILENQLEAAQANLALAQTRLDTAEKNLAEVQILAPADGVIARRHVDLGQVVAPGQKLFTVSVLSSPWIEANFEESDIAAIAPGNQATIRVDAFPGREFKGHVESILPASLSEFSLLAAGSSSGNFVKVTQRVPVRLVFDDQKLPALYPGLNVEVRVTLGTKTGAAPARPASAGGN